MSSEEEICKTCVEEDHHDRTANQRSSSPQVQPKPQLRLHNRGRPTQRPVGHAVTRADYQRHCRDQTFTHQHRRCHTSHHAETPHRCPPATHIADRAQDIVHVQPVESVNEAKNLQDIALKRVTTWRRRRRLNPRRGLGFRPKIMARGFVGFESSTAAPS
jgi:hypothetical protein